MASELAVGIDLPLKALWGRLQALKSDWAITPQQLLSLKRLHRLRRRGLSEAWAVNQAATKRSARPLLQ